MGQMVCDWLDASDEFELVGRVDRGDSLGEALENRSGIVGIDFTEAGLGFKHGLAMLRAGIRPLIGTSGVSPEEIAELHERALAASVGGLVVPNFSLGMCALQEAAQRIAALNHETVRIIEMHHTGKVDAPSGTALDTARRIQAAGDHSEVPIHSIRSAGVHARQEVVFGSSDERLSLTHEAFSREAYLPGIRIALRFVATARGIHLGLQSAIQAQLQ